MPGDDEHGGAGRRKSPDAGNAAFVMRLARSSGGQMAQDAVRNVALLELGESGAIISGCRASVMRGWMRSLPR